MEKQEMSSDSNILSQTQLLASERKLTRAPSEFKESYPFSAVACPAKGGNTVRIVIADDDTMFRESLRMLLETGNDFEVLAGCSDAIATLQLVRKLKPEVLLMDCDLPREGGTEILGELKHSEPDVKVILLCHTISREETISALRMGARGIVLTTEPTESLVECIQRVMRGEYWLGKDGIRDLVHALCSFGETNRPAKNRFGLTKREMEMIQAVVEGYSNPEIAANFSVSEQTVKHHLSHIFDKLGVYSRLELALFAVNHGLNAD